MKVSVVLVNYNGGELLRRPLESLAVYAGPDVEVVVADNASSDGSPEWVEDAFAGVRVLRLGENLGFGAANNRAVAATTGEHVLLLNPDAWLADAEALPRLVEALDADSRLGLVAPRLRYPDGRWQFEWAPETGVLGEALQQMRNPFEGRWWNHRLLPPLLRVLTGPGWTSAACMLVRRTAFEEVGGFDEGFFLYFEDVDLSRRMRLAGWSMRTVWAARVVHVKGFSRGTESELAYRRSQLRYYRKHRPSWEYRFLWRRLRRKAERLAGGDERRRLLAILDEAPTAP